MDGQREVTYWIDRAAWGQHIASRALAQLLDVVPDRPLRARAASDNAASLRVLEKAGFEVVGTETSYASARGIEIEETILRLAQPVRSRLNDAWLPDSDVDPLSHMPEEIDTSNELGPDIAPRHGLMHATARRPAASTPGGSVTMTRKRDGGTPTRHAAPWC